MRAQSTVRAHNIHILFGWMGEIASNTPAESMNIRMDTGPFGTLPHLLHEMTRKIWSGDRHKPPHSNTHLIRFCGSFGLLPPS